MAAGAVPGASARLPTVGNTQPASPNRNDSLARTAQTLQAVQAMQTAARNLARGGPASLAFDPNHRGVRLSKRPKRSHRRRASGRSGTRRSRASGSRRKNAKVTRQRRLPTQSTANGQTSVNIVQNAQQALLNWQTFNVGKETTVSFDQTAGGPERANGSPLTRSTIPPVSHCPDSWLDQCARPIYLDQPERNYLWRHCPG